MLFCSLHLWFNVSCIFAILSLAGKLRKVPEIAWSFSVKIFQALIWFSSHLVNAWKFKFPLWKMRRRRRGKYIAESLYCDSKLAQQEEDQNFSTAVSDFANWPIWKSESHSKLNSGKKLFQARRSGTSCQLHCTIQNLLWMQCVGKISEKRKNLNSFENY